MGNLTTVNYNIERKIKENFDNEAYINKETQNLKYKPIEEEYAYKIKEILKVCQLEREINLDILSNKIIIQHISKPIDVGENGYSCALFKDKQNSDFDENDEYELSLGVFDFDEESRIKGTTVYLQHWGSVIDFLDSLEREDIDLSCCNNFKMCCGEGVCGSCTARFSGHRVKRFCKVQASPRGIFEGRRLI